MYMAAITLTMAALAAWPAPRQRPAAISDRQDRASFPGSGKITDPGPVLRGSVRDASW